MPPADTGLPPSRGLFPTVPTRRRHSLPAEKWRAMEMCPDLAERRRVGMRPAPAGHRIIERWRRPLSPLLSITALSGLLLAAAPTYLLFGEPGTDWVLLSGAGDVLERMRDIGGVQPTDAAVSPDGKRWAVATRGDGAMPELLLFTSLAGLPRRIPGRGNVLDGVRFSADGEWVFFSSNDAEQKKFDKQPMLYAQVYRVRFGGGLPERLTLSRGCHMWPTPLTNTKLMVSHATCAGGRSLEVLGIDSKEEAVLLPPDANIGETAPHPDGRRILFTRTVPAGQEFRVGDLKGSNFALWTTTPIASTRIRPQWAEGGKALFFQNNRRIWKLDESGQMARVVDLETSQ